MQEDTFMEMDITNKRLFWLVDAQTATYVPVDPPAEPLFKSP